MSKNDKFARRANFIQQYRQKMHKELDAMGYPGGKCSKTAVKLSESDRVWINAWGEVCPLGCDPSASAHRVALVR